MDGVEKITRGWWRPTPGSIYPLLNDMKEEGLIKKLDDGRYELTSKAHSELDVSFSSRFRRPNTVEHALREIESLIMYLEDLEQSNPESLSPQGDRIKALGKRMEELGG